MITDAMPLTDERASSILHSIPCHVHFTGKANVSDYFSIYSNATSNQFGIRCGHHAGEYDSPSDEKCILNPSAKDQLTIRTTESVWPLRSSFRGRPWLGTIIHPTEKEAKDYQYALLALVEKSVGDLIFLSDDTGEPVNDEQDMCSGHPPPNVLVRQQKGFDQVIHWEWDPSMPSPWSETSHPVRSDKPSQQNHVDGTPSNVSTSMAFMDFTSILMSMD